MKIFSTIMLVIFPFLSFSQEGNFVQAQLSTEIKDLINKIEKYPDSSSIHSLFLRKFQIKDSLALEKQYEYWLNKFPKSAVIPFELGRYYCKSENPKAKKYLLRATEINSNNADIWNLLSIDALRWGDDEGRLKYLKKAIAVAPNNPQYYIGYLYSLEGIPKLKSDSIALDVFLRFKGMPDGAKALAFLAKNASSTEVKGSYYELLLKNYSVMQPPAFKSGISEYFSILLEAGLYNKAFDLALNMVPMIVNNKLEWKYKLKVASQFLIYKDFLNQNKPEKALEALNEIKLNDDLSASWVDVSENVLLLKAKLSESTGALQAGYNSILNYYSDKPSFKIRDILFEYGAKLKKDTNEVEKEVYNIRDLLSKQADTFSLVNYLTGEKVALSDYKGKIVLLTFWFPGCGPCRAEFPYFEAALSKFDKNEIAYLAVNTVRTQDEYVLPFLNNTKYTFTPLQDNISWNKGNLRRSGAPANFLIDQRGKIMWSDFYINEYSKTDLELMLQLLL